jgi:hypothetical protein
MSFFRNKGFWYLGNLTPWPPETHYRCVEADGCNFMGELPTVDPEAVWTSNRKFTTTEMPKLSDTPCASVEL